MVEVKVNINKREPNSFDIYDEDGKAGGMIFDIIMNDLTVYHTEIDPIKEGKGYARQLLDAMVDYVRKHHLKVIPLCPYLHNQFSRNEVMYNDIWNKINEV